MKGIIAVLLVILVAGCASTSQELFDGETLEGWELKAVHGGQGGIWTVEDGVLVANQAPDHTGGLLGTEAEYADVEVELDFMLDYPVDTGLFLRTREDGMGYQITLDHKEDGYVGSLYAPAEGGFIAQYEDWEDVFREGEWNHLRVRIEGQPAHVSAWLNGVQTLDFHDTEARYPRQGYIGLQVHGGEGAWGMDSRARFRDITVRPID